MRAAGEEMDRQVVDDRARDDAAITAERRVADETLAAERTSRRLALATLLASERANIIAGVRSIAQGRSYVPGEFEALVADRILAKLGAHSLADLVRYAAQAELLES